MLFRDALQPRKEDDHVVAEVLPHREKDDRRHGPTGIAQPVDRPQSQSFQTVVEKTAARVQQVTPYDSDGDEGGDDRREEGNAEEGLEPRKLRVQQQRRTEGSSDRQRHADAYEVKR